MQRMRWQRFKIVAQIEGLGRFVLGVDQQCTNADGLGGSQRPQNGVFQQTRSDSLSVPRAIHRQASEQHGRNRMAWDTFLQPRRRFRMDDLRRGEAVIADDDVAIAGRHECAGSSSLVIRQRMLDQVVVQRRGATVESRDLMVRPDGLRPV